MRSCCSSKSCSEAPVRREHLAARQAHLESLREVKEEWAGLKPFLTSGAR